MVSKSTAVKLGVVVIAGVFNLVPSIASAADSLSTPPRGLVPLANPSNLRFINMCRLTVLRFRSQPGCDAARRSAGDSEP